MAFRGFNAQGEYFETFKNEAQVNTTTGRNTTNFRAMSNYGQQHRDHRSNDRRWNHNHNSYNRYWPSYYYGYWPYYYNGYYCDPFYDPYCYLNEDYYYIL